MYACTSMYLNTHTSFMESQSSAPLPFTTTTSLTTPPCAVFIELFLLKHLRCFFVNDDRQRRVFCRPAVHDSHAQRATAALRSRSRRFPSARVFFAGGSLGAWRTSVSRHYDECENFLNWWLKTIIVLRIAACEGEQPDGSSVASKGSKGHRFAPVQLRLRPSTFAVATDTTTGEPFNFFLAEK